MYVDLLYLTITLRSHSLSIVRLSAELMPVGGVAFRFSFFFFMPNPLHVVFYFVLISAHVDYSP